jgi:hypothetical protein
MKNIITLILTLSLLAGCGGDFQWLPDNQPITPTPPTPAGTVKKTIPFPAGISWVVDLASDRTGATLWLLTGASNSAATALVQVNSSTGQVVNTLAANNWPIFINQNSSLAFDGQQFWATSYGFLNGIPQSFIYELDGTARVIATYQCPATTTGFCQGLAWDGATFWTAGSDNSSLARFELVGTALQSQSFNNLWDTAGVTDVAFDTGAKQVLVTKNQLLFFSLQQATVVAKQTLPQTGTGDWDGSLLWVIDNTNRKILGMTIR